MKYGRLTVIDTYIDNGRRKAICLCDCGKTKHVQMTHLKSGATTSCGCYQKEMASASSIRHGKSKTSLHNRWKAIKQRCLNPKNGRYADYGGRGIDICEEWLLFENFEKWANSNGYDEKLSLDRIDNDLGYSPSNCRWVSVTSNNRNRRITATIEGIPLKEVSVLYNIKYGTLKSYYYKGKIKTLQDVKLYANQLPTTKETK